MLRTVTYAERAAQPHGARILIVGQSGVGKTSLARGLKPGTFQFVNVEGGTLCIEDLELGWVIPETWGDCRDWAVRVGGIDPASPPGAPYSAEHLRSVGGLFPDLERYETFFIDSLTAIARLSFRWAEAQISDKKDHWAVYALHGREMIQWLTLLQHIPCKNIVMTAILELHTDNNGFKSWRIQMEGRKAPKEMIGIIDEIITMEKINFGDGELVRAFICNNPNQWGFPAEDRSGKLEHIEEPDLGKLINKLNRTNERTGERT
jgi:GTPase SAR1 family protein